MEKTTKIKYESFELDVTISFDCYDVDNYSTSKGNWYPDEILAIEHKGEDIMELLDERTIDQIFELAKK